MTSKSVRWTLGTLAFVVVFSSPVLSQEITTRPTQPEVESFFVMPHPDFKAKIVEWTTYDVMNIDQEKLKAELSASKPAKPVHIYQCGPTASAQQQTAKKFAPYADVLSHSSFWYASNDKPTEGDLYWPSVDQPFINHIRKMREIVGATPIVAQLHATVGGDKEKRSTLLEEVQWQFVAVAGCGYRGVWWPVSYEDDAWGETLKRIAKNVNQHGHSLAQARAVDWAKASKEQPISALASEEHLFVFLLHPAYMNLSDDGKTVIIPLDKSSCEGTVTVTLPKGLEIRRGQTLEGQAIRLTRKDAVVTARYSFTSGGEMLLFTLTGKAEQSADTEPAAADPVNTETE